MSETELNKQQREERFVSIVNAPEKFSEEELCAFFSQQENREDYHLFRLIRRVENREHIDAPDAERAWNSFKREHLAPEPKAFTRRTAWGAALLGAAAACIGVLLYTGWPFVRHEASLVAMEYDDTPQLVVLQEEDQPVETFARKDSISFIPATPSVSPAATAKNEAQAKMRTLSTPRGVDFKIVLPDGTCVWLNAESSLQFPSAFTQETRKVILNGEAYFKVAHDKECPFVVETEKMNVQVLGTEFNFRNYESERPQLSLIDGSVSIWGADSQEQDIVLKPGQGAYVETDGSIHVLTDIDTYGAVQWINGYFYFRNRPFIEILQELGRWYNAGVVFENTERIHDKMHFSALRSASIEEAIGHLNRLLRGKISLENNNIVVR